MTVVRLAQSAIWYSACNEDAQSEIAAIDPRDKRVLCVTASGSRAFDLLLADPTEVVALDQNPAQTSLAELVAAAYAQLDYIQFSGLMGLRACDDRPALLTRLVPYLSQPARDFWQRNSGLAQDGLLYCGKWETFLRRFRGWLGRRRRALADRLLRCETRAQQWALWQAEWDDWRWRIFLRALAWRPLWRWGLREPGIAFVPADFDMAGYASARFDHAASNLHFAQLPFAWLLFNGAYYPEILPPYLTEAGHAVIRDRIRRLTLRTASLQETLDRADVGSFDGASLSDYSSYCDVDEQRLVWRGLRRAMRPSAVVCERKFFNKTGMDVPLEFGFARDHDVEGRLNAADGAWFYSFVVARAPDVR